MDTLEAVDIVSSYMLRASDALRTSQGSDLVLRALNNAKKFAQRRHDFELNRVQVDVTVSPLPTGGDISTAVLHGTATSVSVKKIERPYLQLTTGEFYPCHFISQNSYADFLRKRIDTGTININVAATQPLLTNQDRRVIQAGVNKLYLVPEITTPQVLVLDVIQWLPDYGFIRTGLSTSTSANNLVASAATFTTWAMAIGQRVVNTTTGASALITGITSQTQLALSANIFTVGDSFSIQTGITSDFFMDNAFDYLMYRAIAELNFFLKEDQRVSISQGKMQESWDSVIAWDSTLVPQTLED